MKIVQISSKRTKALAKQILGDMYEEGLWNDLLALDLTPTQKDLPVLARFVKEGNSINEIAKWYRIFNNSKIRDVDIYQFKSFQGFIEKVSQEKSILSPLWEELSQIDPTDSKIYVNQLLRLINNGNVTVQNIQHYFDEFMGSDLKETKNFNDYKTFQELEQDIDSIATAVGQQSDSGEHQIYEDENLTIALGDSRKKCIDLSRGYTFCIGRSEIASNLYNSYRQRKGEPTFYFVSFKNRTPEQNNYIVIHVYNDGLKWTSTRNTGDHNTTESELLEMFPELDSAFKKGILKNKPLTEREKEMLNPVDDSAFENFSYDEKTEYAGMGHNLGTRQFSLLDKDQKGLYINTLTQILPESRLKMIKDDKSLFNRYQVIYERIIGGDDGKVPESLIDSITKYMEVNFSPPSYALDWCKEVLDNGEAPAIWIDSITNYIEKYGNPPVYALDWCKEVLKNGHAPEIWKDSIATHIEKYGHPPMYARDWVKEALDNGEAPAIWIDLITKYMETNFSPPSYALDWCKKVLDNGEAPAIWIDRINSYIEEYGLVPSYASDWSKQVLESGEVPKDLIDSITKSFDKFNRPPYFAQDWCQEVLKNGGAPQIWKDSITQYIEKSGLIPSYARDWVKEVLDRGDAPQSWKDSITKHIEKYDFIPLFAQDWCKELLDNGEAPANLINVITKYIEKYGVPQRFARDWYANQQRDQYDSQQQNEEGQAEEVQAKNWYNFYKKSIT